MSSTRVSGKCLNRGTIKANMKRAAIDFQNLVGNSQVFVEKMGVKRNEQTDFAVFEIVRKDKRNFMEFLLVINGEKGTPYEGKKVSFSVSLSGVSYPTDPPKVKCITRIIHPNFTFNGDICLDILKNEWASTMSLESLALDLRSFLCKPNADDPLDTTVGNIYRRNKKRYVLLVMAYAAKYASSEAQETIRTDWQGRTQNYKRSLPRPGRNGCFVDRGEFTKKDPEGKGVVDMMSSSSDAISDSDSMSGEDR